MICKNCQSEFDDSFKYCPDCGQKADTRRLNWISLSDNLAKGWFGSDRGIFFTLKALFTRPGKMMKEYVEGKRIQYFGPFQMLFLLAALYYFLHFVFGLENEKIVENNNHITINAKSVEFPTFVNQLIAFISNNLTLLWLLSLPFLTWAFRLVLGRSFRKTYNFVESNFMITYCISQLMIFNILGLLLDVIFGSSLGLSDWTYVAFLFLFAWDLKQIVVGSFMRNVGKGAGIFILTITLIIIILFVILMLVGLSLGSIEFHNSL